MKVKVKTATGGNPAPSNHRPGNHVPSNHQPGDHATHSDDADSNYGPSNQYDSPSVNETTLMGVKDNKG